MNFRNALFKTMMKIQHDAIQLMFSIKIRIMTMRILSIFHLNETATVLYDIKVSSHQITSLNLDD